MVYNASLKEELSQRKYIIDNIDNAISHGYIKVFFQPVIRTYTGYLNGLEALARWDDPKYGMISPAVFVPILEQSNLVYKIDNYVVEYVAKILRERLDRHVSIVPVSINLSRNSFSVSSPFDYIEKTLVRYSLQREFINIELTESAVIEDPDFIRKEIDRFRAAGYEVWMDDFGSGYSSLNVLKNFMFDEIKIDMLFLKDLNERSKQIVTATVDMAKKLGIHTLAEGVETKEQLEFLRHIGCEKIQGFYYGRPMPLHKLIPHLKKNHILFEDSMLRDFYNKAGRVNVITNQPIGIFFDDGIRFKELYLNDSYKERLLAAGFSGEHPVEEVMRPESDFNKTFRRLAEQSIVEKGTVTMDFVLNNRYFRFISDTIARCSIGYLHVVTVEDITYDGEKKTTGELDSLLRRVITIYGALLLFDAKEQTFSILKINYGNDNKSNGKWHFYESKTSAEMSEYVHWKDQEHFLRALKQKNIKQTLSRTRRGSFTDTFRIRDANGNFKWTSFTFVIMENNARNHMYMVCIKPSSIADKEDPDAFARTILEHNSPQGTANDDSSRNNIYFTLWNTLIDQTDLKLFWKDKNRRFLGATKAFLDYYNFSSIKDIEGKTDDELGWHPDNRPFRAHEEKVLKTGAIIKEAYGTNVIRGVVHNISATKVPVYQHGNITGLLGYFFDLDLLDKECFDKKNEILLDKTTSLMNMRGFLSALSVYEDSNNLNHEDIALVIIDIPIYSHLHSNFGVSYAEKMIALCADILRKHFGKNAAMSRIQHARFCLLVKEYESREILENHLDCCLAELEAINEVEGRHITVYASMGLAFSCESENFYQLMEIAMSRMVDSKENLRSLTPSELELKIRSLRTIFDSVRLIDVSKRKNLELLPYGKKMKVNGSCTAIFGRKRRCTNCIAATALKHRGIATKFDKIGDDICFLFANYVNVLGSDYVIESMIKLEEAPFCIDPKSLNFVNLVDKFNSEIYTDALTKTKNRKYYNEQLLNSESDAIAFMAIDRFKSINETFGRQIGDEVLISVVQQIKHSIRSDDLVLRYAGEEFVICFNSITRKHFEQLLEQIRQNVSSLFADPDKTARITLSIGGCYGHNKTDYLLLKANDALIEAQKGAGIVIITTNQD